MNKNFNQSVFSMLLAIGLSSLAYYCSTWFNNIWILLWIAPVPILIYALKASWSRTLIAGAITSFLGNLSLLPYLHMLPAWYVFWIPTFIYMAMFVAILSVFRKTALSKFYWSAGFVFAIFWTTADLIQSLVAADGTLASIAYTQLSNLPVIQISYLTGIWGITFLLTLIPASIALFWYYRKAKHAFAKILLIPLVLFLLTIGFGYYRLATSAQGPTLKVGVVAAVKKEMQHPIAVALKDKQDLFAKYARGVKTLAEQGAEVILLPEDIMIIRKYDSQFLQQFAELAKESKVFLLVGLHVQTTDSADWFNSPFLNTLYVFSPKGKIVAEYYKQHPLLIFESTMIRGNKLVTMDVPNKGKWGFSICKDNDFINPDRAYSRAGINILFAPALDGDVDWWVHARPALMQSVEGNYAVVRAGQDGMLSISDSRGRIVKMTRVLHSQDLTMIYAEVKTGEGKSFYSKIK
jgi:apolipoprotein N-acyltransferase